MLSVVTGHARSGTSLMMHLHWKVLGEDGILGVKFPLDVLEKNERESNKQFALRKYLRAKTVSVDHKDMNPNGLWESIHVKRGFRYNVYEKSVLENVLENDYACKVMPSGLLQTEPKYISRVVQMLRHPQDVAKSQIRLKRGFKVSPNEHASESFEKAGGGVVFNPARFIHVCGEWALWRINNPDVPLLRIMFDDLIDNPDAQLRRLTDFYGKDFGGAREIIDTSLRRSKQEVETDGKLWEDSFLVWDNYLNENYEAVLEYRRDPRSEVNRVGAHWLCPRAGRNVMALDCSLCTTDIEFRRRLRAYNEATTNNWAQEPCPFECGMDLDRDEHLTIKESVDDNSWNDAGAEISAVVGDIPSGGR